MADPVVPEGAVSKLVPTIRENFACDEGFALEWGHELLAAALDHLASTDEGRAYLLNRALERDDLEWLLELVDGYLRRLGPDDHKHRPEVFKGEWGLRVKLRAALGERES